MARFSSARIASFRAFVIFRIAFVCRTAGFIASGLRLNDVEEYRDHMSHLPDVPEDGGIPAIECGE